jgi:transposase
MGKRQRFTQEFKLKAVRLLKQSGRPAAELARLKRDLAWVTEERDILKKAAAYFAKDLP